MKMNSLLLMNLVGTEAIIIYALIILAIFFWRRKPMPKPKLDESLIDEDI